MAFKTISPDPIRRPQHVTNQCFSPSISCFLEAMLPARHSTCKRVARLADDAAAVDERPLRRAFSVMSSRRRGVEDAKAETPRWTARDAPRGLKFRAGCSVWRKNRRGDAAARGLVCGHSWAL